MDLASDISADLTLFAQALLETAAVRHSQNVLLGMIVAYHDAEPAYQPDPTSEPLALPATVDVLPLPRYLRRIEAPGHIRPGEIPLGPALVSGAYPIAQRICVVWPGVPSLQTAEPLLPGGLGFLHLMGKNHADCLSIGGPADPEFAPNPLRVSDAVFVPGFVSGLVSSTLPPEARGGVGTMPQIGPADARAVSTFIRLLGTGWSIGGTAVKLGGDAAALGVGRVGDPVGASPAMLAYMQALEAALLPFGIVVPTPFAAAVSGPMGQITAGSAITTSL